MLVVDDDDVDRERVLRILNRPPFDVISTEASSGAQALEKAGEQPFDCVLLDNRLGDAMGAELLPQLKRSLQSASCPVIMVTGEGDERLAVQVLQEGAADYVPKRHLSAEVLVQSISHCLERQRLHDEQQRLHAEQQRLRDQLTEAHRRLEAHVREQERAIERAETRANELAGFNQAVIQSSPVGIAVFRPDGRCVLSNAAASEAFHLSHAALMALDFRTLGWWRTSGLSREAEAALVDGRPRRCEVRVSGQGRPGHWIECAVSAIDYQGDRCLLLITHDVSEQRAARDELAAARDVAHAIAQAKGSFLANMSHEIRTPMNAIVGLSRLALEDELRPRTREFLSKVHSSAVALMGLLDDVLDYSKIEAGQMHFESIDFDLDEVLQRLADLFAARVEQKGLELVIDVARDVPPRLVGDPLRLSQVLSNLVGNAVKFTEEGEVVVQVEVEAPIQNKACCLRFVVHDTGIGIPPASQPGLFDAFTQADSSITRRFGGSGLGLAICKALVRQMGGEIAVSSMLGGGSEFVFTAKLGVAASDALAADRAALSGLRVLVIDDNAASRHALAHELESLAVRWRVATNVPAALRQNERAHRESRPADVVLLDAKMPGVDSLQVVEQLHQQAERHGQRRPDVILLVTPFGREAFAVEQARGGHQPDGVLGKPVLRTQLVDTLVRVRQGARSGSTGRAPQTIDQLRVHVQGLGGAHVLLAEDNAVNQLVAAELLTRLGLHVTMTSDGNEAVEAVRGGGAGAFDAVLMDLHMPVLDGFEATRRIHQVPWAAQLPVIAMSAAVLPADRAQSFAAGMVDHVAKPIVAERLVEVLLKWIPRRNGVESSDG